MKLVIVESPAKCKKIQSYLGDGFIVKASFGHFREIDGGLKGIHPDTCMPTYKVASAKRKYVSDLTKYVKQADKIYLATDDDREGEAIAWHLCDYFGLSVSTTPRLIFHEITKPAIQRAIQSPTLLDMNKVHAQFARQVLDLLIGFKVSPLLSKAIPAPIRTTTVSAGRCQTPTLRLVYDNQQEIHAHPPKQTYTIQGTFLKKAIRFVLTEFRGHRGHHARDTNDTNNDHRDDNADDGGDNDDTPTTSTLDDWMSKQSNVITFLNHSISFKHMFECHSPRPTVHKPPQPFTTSSFQQSANTQCHISPKQAMNIAQKLYESGWITYMRTDSKLYSADFVEEAYTYIASTYGEEYKGTQAVSMRPREAQDDTSVPPAPQQSKAKPMKPKKTKTKKPQAQEAHEAIRPTQVSRLPSSITDPQQRKVYTMIWRNTIASCMANATGKEVMCTITCPNTGKTANTAKTSQSQCPPCHYVNKQEQYTFMGWKRVYQDHDSEHDSNNVPENEVYAYVLGLPNKGRVRYSTLEAIPTIKDAKQRYTEAGLVRHLERKGIGRPSTYSYLIDKIQQREYVKCETIQHEPVKAITYTLRKEMKDISELVETAKTISRTEHKKLNLQEVGKHVIDFLCDSTNPLSTLFAYEYTAQMEEDLDRVSRGECDWTTIVKGCISLLNNAIPVSKTHAKHLSDKQKIQLAGSLEKYKEEQQKKRKTANEPIGQWKGKRVYVKEGRYGKYAQLGNAKDSEKVSLKSLDASEPITWDKVHALLTNPPKPKNVVRVFTKEISLRKGKYGEYLMIYKPHMTKPKFMNIKPYKGDIHTDAVEDVLAWVDANYA